LASLEAGLYCFSFRNKVKGKKAKENVNKTQLKMICNQGAAMVQGKKMKENRVLWTRQETGAKLGWSGKGSESDQAHEDNNRELQWALGICFNNLREPAFLLLLPIGLYKVN
jgi:hypothetical protein